MSDQTAREHARDVLAGARTIAVVGFSTAPDKPSHRAPMELVRRGFNVIPVHPTATEVAGIPAVSALDQITEHVDLVDVFRPASEGADVARQAVAIGADALWLQLDIRSPEARQIATDAGLEYVEDECVEAISRGFNVKPPA